MGLFFENSEFKGRGANRTVFIFIALISIYSIAIYSKSLQNDFVWDSIGVILEDPSIRDLTGVLNFFKTPLVLGETGEIGDGLTVSGIQYYRPLLSVFHAFEYSIFGASPLGYKAVNLLLNCLVVALSFLVTRQITGSFGVAALSTLLFASAPARAEAVYWVYSDSHILSAIFSLLAFLAYLKERKWVGTLVFAVGLLFQEGGVLLPVVLFAYEGTRRSSRQLWTRSVGIVSFGVISAIFLVARHFIVGRLPTSFLDPWSLLLAVGYQSWEHARIFFMPDASATVYLYSKDMFSLWGSASIIGIVALLMFSGVGAFLWRFKRADCFWFFWFVIWIAVAFNVGSYGGYLMAEKTLYLASLGLSVLIVRLLSLRKQLQCAGLVVIGGLFIFNSTQVYARADSWANTATYVARILEFEPEFDLALVAGGNTAQLEGRYQDAADYYLRALRRRPDLAAYMGKRYVENILRWAEELAEQGESDQAIQALENAVEAIPGDSRIYNGMGVVYYLSGDREKARKNWNLALQFDPANLEASQNLKLLDASR